MQFAVKCTKHYPGYEKAHASDLAQLKEQVKSWRGCDAEFASALHVPDDFDMELTKEGDANFPIKEKLLAWTISFTERH